MARIYVDEQGIATPRRPMTLQENYGTPRNVSAGRIPYTGGGQPVGAPSGISRPGIATGPQHATQVPVNPRRVPAVRPPTAPIAASPAAPPAANPARGFTLGAEGATVSPARPSRPVAQIGYTPAEPLENIDADVRSRINGGSRRFVGPQPSGMASPIATPATTITFGGRGGAQPVLAGGGIAGELYRAWSRRTGRYIPGLEQVLGSDQPSFNPGELRQELHRSATEDPRQTSTAAGQEVRQPLPPRQATGPVDAPLHYENLGLGPNDLSRTSTGRIPSPVKPVGIADGEGTGYAVVGGKRISYRDIGTRQDPLASRRTDGIATAPDGQTVLLGNAAGYRPSRDVDWSPGSANERTTQLAAAERQGMAPDGQGGFRPLRQYERDAAGLTTKQDTIDSNNKAMQDEINSIAYNMRNDYDGFARIMQSKARIAALRGQNALLQQGIAGDQALAAHQYTADQNLRGHQYTADSLRATKDAENNAAQAESLRKQQEQERKSRQDDRKRRDAQVRSHLDRYDWGKISPTAANEYAGLLVDTDGKGYVTLRDPSGTYGDVMVHQGVEQGLRSAYGKIRTADQFQAWLNQARKLGGNNAPVYQTSIKNSASLPLLRSKQVPLTQEDNVNG